MTAANTNRIWQSASSLQEDRAGYIDVEMKIMVEGRVEGTYVRSIGSLSQMRINTQPSPICLCKPPKNIFRSFIDIGSTSVFGEVMDERDFG